jgi:starch synthase
MPMNDLRILFCASEVAPYAKTGGLADVAEALPVALSALGCDVRVFMPWYRCVRDWVKTPTIHPGSTPISVGIHDYRVSYVETRTISGLPLYLLEKDEFYDRGSLYGTPNSGDYDDNAERFITFCLALRPLCEKMNWFPSIIHLHDWQTGLAAAYHYLSWRHEPNFAKSGTVFTIHNLAYQGIFPEKYFSLTNLPAEAFSLGGIEFWGNCNFLKAGLMYSDYLTTVSPRYSQEIQTSECGHGLDGVLRERKDCLSGILNGIDQVVWNPVTDSLIAGNYSSSRLSGKRQCKEALLSEFGFSKRHSSLPLVGMIGRLATQKGFRLLHEIVDELMSSPLLLIILGSGDSEIGEMVRAMAARYPDLVKVRIEFNEPLAHRIEAGADMFLMPSSYEPCGLNQMYSLRYGTIPIVHATGGLDDSVVDVQREPLLGTGFKFYRYEAAAFVEAIQAALQLYENKPKWIELQRRAMAWDFSWKRSAEHYLDVYRKVLSSKQQRTSP